MDLHIDNILKDLEKDDIQAYLLTQFTNVEYISNYKPTRPMLLLIIKPLLFVLLKKIQLFMPQKWIWK